MTKQASIKVGDIRLVGTTNMRIWAEPAEILAVEQKRVLVRPLAPSTSPEQWVALHSVLRAGTVAPA